jgi:ferritin-like metal-binding protein YciE
MAAETLRDLYIGELQELYEAEQETVRAVAKLAAMATDADLKSIFEQHVEQSRIHVARLELLFDEYDVPKTPGAPSMIGPLIEASERRVASMKDTYVRDAALIAAAQLVAHCEIAAYGCARTYARQLGLDAAADLLQQTLLDERAADEELTQVATIINGVALPDAPVDESRSSRLRYVGAKNFHRVTHEFADHAVRNAAGDDLGKVDGLLVDASGRPRYLVVNSGGLFVGHRYVVPMSKVVLDQSARTFTIDLNEATLKRYPQFHRHAFLAMTDEEIQLYEARLLDAVDRR